MKTVKIGIIGLGYIGQIHLKHCLKIPNFDVVGGRGYFGKSTKQGKKSRSQESI